MTVISDIGWLIKRHAWPGLKSIVMVESEREIDGKCEREVRFYITSHGADVVGELFVPLLLLHILGALKHLIIDRDGVFARMFRPVSGGR